MGSPLGPTLANAFLVHFEKNCLQNCPSDFKPPYYRRYVYYRLFVKIKHFTLMSNVSLSLVEFIHILTFFYHLPISLVLFTHSLIDACEFALVGLNCTMN